MSNDILEIPPLLKKLAERDKKETKNKIIDIMTNCVKLAVPSKVDCETGKSWGDAS